MNSHMFVSLFFKHTEIFHNLLFAVGKEHRWYGNNSEFIGCIRTQQMHRRIYKRIFVLQKCLFKLFRGTYLTSELRTYLLSILAVKRNVRRYFVTMRVLFKNFLTDTLNRFSSQFVKVCGRYRQPVINIYGYISGEIYSTAQFTALTFKIFGSNGSVDSRLGSISDRYRAYTIS